MNKFEFTITNLTCEACVKMCSMIIRRIDGVKDVSIDLSNGRTEIDSARPIELAAVAERLAQKGYLVSLN